MKPLTSSSWVDSASAKSKGARLVSAIEPIKNIINIGNKGNKNHMLLCNSIFNPLFIFTFYILFDD